MRHGDPENPLPEWMPDWLATICVLIVVGLLIAFMKALDAADTLRHPWRR